jgi:benzylsuccinate CoA-transferase BbsE subunit
MLTGKRILEWTDRVSGAFAGRILADLGAEVIKIEHPVGGDPIRREGPVAPGGRSGEGVLFGYLNHGKKSLTLDPRSPSGRALFQRLAGHCDLLIETELSQDSGDSLSAAALQAANVDLAILTLSQIGFGTTEERLPHTALTLQHRSGYALHQSLPVTDTTRRPPVGCAEREADLVVGVSGASAAMWALLVTAAGGPPPHVDLSFHDFFAANLYPGPLAEWCDGERDFKRSRKDFGGTEVAGGLVWMLQCADGWIMVSPREQHQWARWVEVMGSPDWTRNAPLCGDRNARRDNYVEVQRLMSQWTETRSRREIFDAARAARVACFPVNEARDLLENKQLAARDFFDLLRTASGHELQIPGLPFTITNEKGRYPRRRVVEAPSLGGANEELLQSRLGLSADELEPLRAGGVI